MNKSWFILLVSFSCLVPVSLLRVGLQACVGVSVCVWGGGGGGGGGGTKHLRYGTF